MLRKSPPKGITLTDNAIIPPTARGGRMGHEGPLGKPVQGVVRHSKGLSHGIRAEGHVAGQHRAAKEAAVRYRLLNEPALAESISRDVLAVAPDDRER